MKQTQMSLAKVPNLRQAGKAPLALAALLLLVSVVLAQGGYNISWFTVDGGGGTSSGGAYMLSLYFAHFQLNREQSHLTDGHAPAA